MPFCQSTSTTSSISCQAYQLDDLTDEELIEMARKKHSKAYEILISRHTAYINSILYNAAPDFQDRSDLYQEVCIKIWKNIANLRCNNAFRGWLRQICVHVVHDQFRLRKISTCSLDSMFGEESEGATFDVPDQSADPAEKYQTKCLQEAVHSALSGLPESFRTALVLRAVNDLPYQDIASLTKTDLGTVKSRISRAREKVSKVVALEFSAEERTA